MRMPTQPPDASPSYVNLIPYQMLDSSDGTESKEKAKDLTG